MKQSRKTPISLAVVTLLALLLAFTAPATTTLVQFRAESDLLPIPDLTISVQLVAWIAVVIMAALTGLAWWRNLAKNAPAPRLVSPAVGLVLVIAVLSVLYAGHTMTLTALLQGSLALAVPLIFGSLAGVLSERVGVVNIAIEGQLLAGAFVSALVASLTQSLWLGLLAALVAGALVSLVLAVFAIKYVVDQIIVGVVLNVLVVGLTNFLFTTMMSNDLGVFNSPPRFDDFAIPLLSQIPVIGPVLFIQTPIVYLMYLAVAGVWVLLFKTCWGLRVRAVG